MQDKNGNTARDLELIEGWIADGLLSPAARDMHIQDAIGQYNEANALTADDEDSLIHPDVVVTTVEIDGKAHQGWTLRNNRQVSGTTPDLKILRGCDLLSRELGALVFGR